MNRKITFAAAAAIAALSGFAAHANAGADQLAARAGVEAGAYSVNELTQIIRERHESSPNRNGLNFLLDRSSNKSVGGVNAGAAQLAARAGVEPGVYSVNELTRLIADSHESGRANDNKRNFILQGDQSEVSRSASSDRISDGERQLAARAGVEPGLYSINTLVRLVADEGESGNGYDGSRALIGARGY